MMSKRWIKSQLFGFEVRGTAAIVNGLVHHAPKQVVLKHIKRNLMLTSARLKLNNNEIGSLWLDMVSRYNRISKKTFSSLRKSDSDYRSDLENRQNAVYAAVRKEFDALERAKNSVADEIEYRAKSDAARDMLRDGVFYLCSAHKNPASDHADYQGKVYVNADWASRVDADTAEKVQDYLDKHGTMTVQDVMFSPPYLVTRRNCKHFMIPVSVEDVLKRSVRAMLRDNDMILDEKPMNETERVYKGYYERLKVLVELRKMVRSSELDKDIKRTRVLVRKWVVRARAEK